MRQIAATRRRDRLLQQIASCDMRKSLSLRSVARIQTGLNSCDVSQRQNKRSLVAPCERICDKSLRQNLNQPMRKHQLISHHVKFELFYKIDYVHRTSVLSQHQCRREDLSPRCVAAICRIVCLGLKREIRCI